MRLIDGADRRTGALLLLLGCASLALYRAGLSAKGVPGIVWFIKLALVQSVLYILASWIVVHSRSSRSTLLIVIAFAVAFRFSIVFAPPYLSDDIYRYVWDGRVQAAGINPYRYVPADPALAHLRDEAIYPNINRRDFAPTIYPPLAEFVFFLTTRISEHITWMKLTMLGFEVLTVWAIAQLLASLGLAKQRLLIYAWHPLVIWEFAGSGHVDAVAIPFIVLAFLAWRKNKDVGTGFALASATLVKLFPIALFPALFKRWRLAMPLACAATIIVAYLLYLSVGPKAVMGYLPGYVKETGMDTGEQFYVLSLGRKVFGAGLPALAFRVFAAIVLAALACWVFTRKTENNLKLGMLLATTTMVLFAPHYSWYFTWIVPFLCFTPSAAVFYLTTASFFLYLSWLGDSREEMFFMNSLIYLPFFLVAVVEFFRSARRKQNASA